VVSNELGKAGLAKSAAALADSPWQQVPQPWEGSEKHLYPC